MVGARELPLGEAPGAARDGRAARARVAGVPKPRLYLWTTAIRARLPPAAARAVRRSPSAAGSWAPRRPPSSRVVLAHELAHIRNRDVLVQTTAVVLAAALIELSRVGGWLQRALLFVLGPMAAAFVHLLLSPKREFAADRAAAGALRLAARPRRRADPARAGGRARRVPGEPRHGAALHVQPVRRGGARRALRHPPARRRARPASARARPRLARQAARGLRLELATEDVASRVRPRKRSCSVLVPMRRKPGLLRDALRGDILWVGRQPERTPARPAAEKAKSTRRDATPTRVGGDPVADCRLAAVELDRAEELAAGGRRRSRTGTTCRLATPECSARSRLRRRPGCRATEASG